MKKKTAKKARASKPKSRAAKAAAKPATPAAGATPARVRKILAKLDEAYPAATCALTHHNPFQLLISTILSAQCTDERVNQVTTTLFPKYPTPEAFAYANPADLEKE